MQALKQKPLQWMLVVATAAFLVLAVFGPAMTQPAHQHAFADQRVFANIPHATDVLSNAAFALLGIWGLMKLARLKQHMAFNAEHALSALFFTGLMVTAAASSWYHLQPDDTGLAVDRMGMAVAFVGLLGLAVAGRVSHAAGLVMASAVSLLGPLSIGYWLASANVMPWLIVQFGGMLLILILACIKPLPRPNGLVVRWGVVMGIYAAAKWLELADHEVYRFTSELVSGHSLKHLVASLAAWPVIAAIQSATPSACVSHPEHAMSTAKNTGRIRVTNFDTNVS